jgi:DNA polymerase-3 subunit alpha
MAAMVAAREEGGSFKDIYDLAERVDPKCMSKGILEVLIKAGALDHLGPNRGQHMLVIEGAVNGAAKKAKDKARGQKSLFGDDSGGADDDADSEGSSTLPEAEDWTQAQKLAGEKEVFGFYLTSHPLTQLGDRLTRLVTHTHKELGDMEDGSDVMIGGMISSIKKAATKKPSRNGHTRYANFDFEDSTGIVRCIIWPEDYARSEEKIVPEAICIIKGRVDRRGREPNVIVNQFLTLEDAEKQFTRHLTISFKRGFHTESDVRRTKEVIERFPGKTSVYLFVDSPDEENPGGQIRYTLMPPQEMKVTCTAEFTEALSSVVGKTNFKFYADAKKKSAASTSMGR